MHCGQRVCPCYLHGVAVPAFKACASKGCAANFSVTALVLCLSQSAGDAACAVFSGAAGLLLCSPCTLPTLWTQAIVHARDQVCCMAPVCCVVMGIALGIEHKQYRPNKVCMCRMIFRAAQPLHKSGPVTQGTLTCAFAHRVTWNTGTLTCQGSSGLHGSCVLTQYYLGVCSTTVSRNMGCMCRTIFRAAQRVRKAAPVTHKAHLLAQGQVVCMAPVHLGWGVSGGFLCTLHAFLESRYTQICRIHASSSAWTWHC
jgi:hypothetical protein